jgi:DNA-binding transcriptional ArsR family regulator
MAATSRKSSKDKDSEHLKARPRSALTPRGSSQDARRKGQARRAAILLKPISDPTRLQVILFLAEREQDVGILCVHLGQSQPAISHHLALLRHGGIIASRREGAKKYDALTETGCALAGVVQSLLREEATERPAIRRHPTRASSAPMGSPGPVREKTTNSSGASDPRSEGRDRTEVESWSRMNRRRAELIFRKNRGHLNDAERSELESLQAISRSHSPMIDTRRKYLNLLIL